MDQSLGQILHDCEAVKFGDFTLVNGKKSRYYIDIKKAVTKPKILELVAEHIVDTANDNNIDADYIACIELGGVAIGAMISVITELPLLIIRKAEKNHGMESIIIGDPEAKKVVLLIEDVTTTGGSVINAAHILRNEGMIVREIIAVVDRDEGAEDALEKEGLNLISLVKAKSLIEDYETEEVLAHESLAHSDSINDDFILEEKGK